MQDSRDAGGEIYRKVQIVGRIGIALSLISLALSLAALGLAIWAKLEEAGAAACS